MPHSLPPPAQLPRLRTAPTPGGTFEEPPPTSSVLIVQASGLHDRGQQDGLLGADSPYPTHWWLCPQRGQLAAGPGPRSDLGGLRGLDGEVWTGRCGKESCTYLAPTAYRLSRTHIFQDLLCPEGEARRQSRGQT